MKHKGPQINSILPKIDIGSKYFIRYQSIGIISRLYLFNKPIYARVGSDREFFGRIIIKLRVDS